MYSLIIAFSLGWINGVSFICPSGLILRHQPPIPPHQAALCLQDLIRETVADLAAPTWWHRAAEKTLLFCSLDLLGLRLWIWTASRVWMWWKGKAERIQKAYMYSVTLGTSKEGNVITMMVAHATVGWCRENSAIQPQFVSTLGSDWAKYSGQ